MTGNFSAAPPEEFYAGHRQRQEAYHRLSVSAAAQGDAYLATMAMWASDLSALQTVLWQRVFTVAPGPESQYLIATNALSTALSQQGARSHMGETCEQSVMSLRAVLPSALEPPVYDALLPKLSDASHLRFLPAAEADSPARVVHNHLGDLAPSVFIKERVEGARDLMTLAGNAQASGDQLSAASCAYQAVMLLVDAYLVHVATVLGERSMASAVLRWKLMCEEIQAMGSLPLDADQAVARVLEVVDSVLGSIEVLRLREFAADNALPLS